MYNINLLEAVNLRQERVRFSWGGPAAALILLFGLGFVLMSALSPVGTEVTERPPASRAF